MTQHHHEELEVGQHLDQAVRGATMAMAQLMERLARSSAESDRAAAQALREALLRQEHNQQQGHPEHSDQRDSPAPAPGVDGPQTTDSIDHAEGVESAQANSTEWPGPADGAGIRPESQERAEEILRVTVDSAALTGNMAAEDAAAAAADREMGMVVLPAYRGNPDRGVSPSKADSPQEGDHRRQTWTLARAGWESDQRDQSGSTSGWDDLPMEAKTPLYWAVYDTEEARRVPGHGSTSSPATASTASTGQAGTAGPLGPAPVVLPVVLSGAGERGMSPTKAGTAQERARRRQAWAVAQTRFTEGLGAGVSEAEARKAWNGLDWPEKAVAYWTAYDDPTTTPITERTTDHAAQRTAYASASPAVGPSSWVAGVLELSAGPAGTGTGKALPGVAVHGGELGKQGQHSEQYGEHRSDSAVPVAGPTRERVVELNEQAQRYFAAQAVPGSKGGDYLAGRLGDQVVAEGPFRLGYAPEGWTNLSDHLRKAGASDAEILGAGLGRQSSRGTVIDTFRDRATVAIRDVRGDTVGFVGRDLSGNSSAPKYLNTATTPAFTKGEHVLGLFEAGPDARVVRVEGPFDAIAVTAAGGGVYAGMAPMGTALTDTQAGLLAERSGGRVWEALDADPAGRRAVEKDFWALREKGVDTRLVVLPPGSDPAQLWKDDPDELRAALGAADGAPTAGITVISNTVDDLRSALQAGDADAFEEIAAIQDRVTSGANDGDRMMVNTYVSAKLDAVTANTVDTADRAESVPGRTPLQIGSPSPGAGLVSPAGGQVAASAPTGGSTEGRYDRAQLAQGTAQTTPAVDTEAVLSRTTSAPGFSRPTREMLGDAHHRHVTPANQATAESPTRTVGRGQHR